MATQLQGFPSWVDNNRPVQKTSNHSLRVLLIHPENDFLTLALRSAGYDLYTSWTGNEALQNFHLVRPDVIVLNLCLPDLDGRQVLKRLREWTTTPIIAMSVRKEASETIACLDIGADDYLTEPFAVGELLARMRAVLRRAFGVPRSELFNAGDLTVDFSKREVFVGTTQINLTATEYDLLKVLASQAGLVKTHYQLIHELWGRTEYQNAVHLLRVTVSNLRRKLTRNASILRHIVTVSGVGYRLRPASDWSGARLSS